MSKRSLGLLVEDIWESIEKIERYTDGMSLFHGCLLWLSVWNNPQYTPKVCLRKSV